MRRLLFLSGLLMSILVCGVAFATDPTGTYVNKNGTIIIEKSNNAYLVKVKGKGHEYNNYKENIYEVITENPDEIQNYIEKNVIKKVDNAYNVRIIASKKKDRCDFEGGLVVMEGDTLSADEPIFSLELKDSGVELHIPRVTGGDLCLYMVTSIYKKK